MSFFDPPTPPAWLPPNTPKEYVGYFIVGAEAPEEHRTIPRAPKAEELYPIPPYRPRETVAAPPSAAKGKEKEAKEAKIDEDWQFVDDAPPPPPGKDLMQWHVEHLKRELAKATGGTLIWEDKLEKCTEQLQEAQKKIKKIRAMRKDLEKKGLANDHERMIAQRDAEAKIDEHVRDLQSQLDQCNQQKAIGVEAIATLQARRVREYTKWERQRSNAQRNDRNAVMQEAKLPPPVRKGILRSVMEVHKTRAEEIRKAWEISEEAAMKIKREIVVESMTAARTAQQEEAQAAEQAGAASKEEPQNETAPDAQAPEGEESEQGPSTTPQQDSQVKRRWFSL